MNLGLPYMGSKNKIARKIIDVLPSGSAFVDLFCGGCAVTHAAMLSNNRVCERLFCNMAAGRFGQLDLFWEYVD